MLETTLQGSPVEVDDLDAETLLVLVSDREQASRQAERARLRLAAQWCVLHPATVDTGTASWGDTGLPGVCAGDETLGGEGTPLVSAFAPEPFAAALGVATTTGMQFLADVLDLQFRLPRLWAAVDALEVAPWKARQVAQATHALSRLAASYVDEQLADRNGRAGWRVDLHRPRPGGNTGTSHIDIAGDTLDLAKFHDLVCAQAAELKALGDTDDLDVRKARALGVIADKQATLDLIGLLGDDGTVSTGATNQSAGVALRRAAKTMLHLTLTDLIAHATEGTVAAGSVERLGPATIALIKDWVGSSRVTIQPVLDRGSTAAVDRHDPPEVMREIVILRDGHCVFPWCNRDARGCDLDHVVAYDDQGPPGQTNPDNLAALCRRHHRCKTHGRWRYVRNRDGTYLWRAPLGATYLVTRHGTLDLQIN